MGHKTPQTIGIGSRSLIRIVTLRRSERACAARRANSSHDPSAGWELRASRHKLIRPKRSGDRQTRKPTDQRNATHGTGAEGDSACAGRTSGAAATCGAADATDASGASIGASAITGVSIEFVAIGGAGVAAGNSTVAATSWGAADGFSGNGLTSGAGVSNFAQLGRTRQLGKARDTTGSTSKTASTISQTSCRTAADRFRRIGAARNASVSKITPLRVASSMTGAHGPAHM